MSSRKSATCIGKVSRSPLTEYDSKAEAQEGAAYAKMVHGRDLDPYQCNRCRLWHLAPGDRRTPSTTCHACRGGDGKPKEAYETEQDANRRAEILREERGVVLRAYPCQYGSGWHLTKG